jgi:hypothetical protein
MKKLMLTTAIASVFATAALAQTTITGELRLNYKSASAKKAAPAAAYATPGIGATSLGVVSAGTAVGIPTIAGTLGTANTYNGFGQEQQINIQTKGKLNVGGLDYAAGFSIENDGDQGTSIFNENVFMDLTNASSGTTISFSRDHIQRSDSDRSAAVLVGFSPNELSQYGYKETTLFQQNLGPAVAQNMTAAILQKTPVGTFSYAVAPEMGAPGASEDVSGSNTKKGWELGFTGDLGVKGLNAYAFKGEDWGTVTTSVVEAEVQSYGASYNMGQITAGIARKKYNAAAAASSLVETKEDHYGLAYAVNKDLSVGLLYAKAQMSGAGKNAAQTTDQKIKGINIGYNLGPVNMTVGYAKNTDALGVQGADVDVGMVRLIGAF